MYRYRYRDYKLDRKLKDNQVEPGEGIVGCEMHDVNGWNERWLPPKRARGFLSAFFSALFNWKR